MIRQLIREILLEGLTGFEKRTQDIDYMSSFDDPTFDQTDQKELPYKSQAKDVKRAWAAEADHEFMKSLIKVHWVSGFNWEKKIERFLSLNGNNEISAMGYPPGHRDVSSSWGMVGVLIQGKVTLAANDMNAIRSGYFNDIPKEVASKYKSSGLPRRPTTFHGAVWRLEGSKRYILDKESFDLKDVSQNELIIDNWRPVGLVFGLESEELIDVVRATTWGQSRRPVGTMHLGGDEGRSSVKGLLKHNLPIYDKNMKLIDRNRLEEALLEGDSPTEQE